MLLLCERGVKNSERLLASQVRCGLLTAVASYSARSLLRFCKRARRIKWDAVSYFERPAPSGGLGCRIA